MSNALATSTSTTRFERRRSRTQAALIDAAIQLFQQQGVRATTIEEICELADISPRTFFNHFDTREHLYAAIAGQRAAQFAGLLEAQGADERPLDQRLPELFTAIGRELAQMPAYRELIGEMLRVRIDGGDLTVRGRTLGQAALRFVLVGVERGEITTAHRPEVLADILLGAITTAIGNWSADRSYGLEGELDQAAAALLDLFAPDRRPQSRAS
ncbi:MAG: TetR/AcrR family transcriptional regulator [Actinomycetota bacterium]|jgi:AcrR family transcriptional regulator|nr:TetR/AcrR family transcriptional regulator [Actinomycetota bacterium]